MRRFILALDLCVTAFLCVVLAAECFVILRAIAEHYGDWHCALPFHHCVTP